MKIPFHKPPSHHELRMLAIGCTMGWVKTTIRERTLLRVAVLRWALDVKKECKFQICLPGFEKSQLYLCRTRQEATKLRRRLIANIGLTPECRVMKL